MKKAAIIILLTCLFGRYTYAQRPIEYGFRLGGGLAFQEISNNSILSNNTIRVFDAYALVSIPVLSKYYLRTGVGITNKGTVITEDALTTTNKITYFQFPVGLMHKFDIPNLGKLIGSVGGYFAIGYSGSLAYETPNSYTTNKVIFGTDNDFRQLDAGINLVTGLELINRLTFNLGYDFGLANIASNALRDAGYKHIYNREFSITLGYKFQLLKKKKS